MERNIEIETMNQSTNPWEEFNLRLQRLLDRLMQGGVIPFVGSGISNGAALEAERTVPTEQRSFRTTVDFMKERLARQLSLITDRRGLAWSEICGLLGIPCEKRPGGHTMPTCGPPGRDLIRKHCDLSRLTEILDWLSGTGRSCATLEIEKFAELEPCIAHRYLSYLAREGVISEIITTNYDTCVEVAYLRSFGPPHQPTQEALVIASLEEYRRKGGTRFHKGSLLQPSLRIYKINGCARNYRDLKKRSKMQQRHIAQSIILTERQLQHFGERQWAKDLLKDRARTCSFLFTGFGSDEPQVRHTVLALMEEFQQGRNNGSRPTPHNVEDVAALTNAPYVHAYERELSYSQAQVLFGFYQAHLKHSMSVFHAPRLNAFTLRDYQFFIRRPSGEPKGLGADLFWQRLFQAAFKPILSHQTRRGSAFFRWLQDLGITEAGWQHGLVEWLYPVESSDDKWFAALFGRHNHLLEPEPATGGERRPLRLWHWLWAILHPQAQEVSEDWYLPTWQAPLLIPATLALLRLLAEDDNGTLTEKVEPVRGRGLAVRTSEEVSYGLGCIYLIHEHASFPELLSSFQADSHTEQCSQRGRLVLQILVPANPYEDDEQLVYQSRNSGESDESELWVARCTRISAAKLLAEATDMRKGYDALRRVVDERAQPRERLEPIT